MRLERPEERDCLLSVVWLFQMQVIACETNAKLFDARKRLGLGDPLHSLATEPRWHQIKASAESKMPQTGEVNMFGPIL
jgi:hypothetical protein